MTSYKIQKDDKVKKLGKKSLKVEGLLMNPKLKNHNTFVDVKEIIIVNPNLKEKVLIMQFHIAFRRLLRLIMSLSEEDATDGDIKLAFNEVEKMKRVLKEKYEHQIDMEEYHRMWKKACLLESDLKQIVIQKTKEEQLYFRQMMEQNVEEERGRGR